MKSSDRAKQNQIRDQYLEGKIGYDAAMNALRFAGMSEANADNLLHPPGKFLVDREKRIVNRSSMLTGPSKEPYPITANAAYIWTVGGKLFLGLPSETAQPHTVIIPLDKMIPDTGLTGLPKAHHRGFAILLGVLKQREEASRRPTIGAKGAPDRATVQAAAESDEKYRVWLKALGQKAKEEKAAKAEAAEFLKALGLDI